MARPTNSELDAQAYLKEQCQQMEVCFNQLEEICKKPKDEQADLLGTIGVLVGKAMIRFVNIENSIGVYGK